MDAPPPILDAPQPMIPRGGETAPPALGLIDLLAAACTAGGLASLAASLAEDQGPWWLDMLSPFALHSAIALAIGAIAWMGKQRPILAALTGAALAVQLMRLAPVWTEPVDPPRSGERLAILHLNVHATNDRFDEIAALIAESDADVAVVVELSPAMAERLAKLPEPWRPWQARPSSDPFGLGVYARRAASSTAVRMIDATFPAIEATVALGGDKRLRIVAAHVLPAINEAASAHHHTQLDELATLVRSSTLATIVVADLNATIWSSGFAKIAPSGVDSASLGQGYTATWPSALGALGIPIDHVLIPPSLTTVEHEAVEIPGSDHRGLRVILAPARSRL